MDTNDAPGPQRWLLDVLYKGAESRDLDYKASCVWDEGDKAACCRLVKDILGMANSLGGFLVIGVSESTSGFSHEGLAEDALRSFETSRLNRFLQNYADPPVNTRLHKVADKGRSFAIVEVPRFSDTPHVCQRDMPNVLARGALYVRTANNETAPIVASADFRMIVEQAVRNRRDSLLSAFRALLEGNREQAPDVRAAFLQQRLEALERYQQVDPYAPKSYTGYRETTFHPIRFEPARYDLAQLRAAAFRGHVDFRGWPFLFISEQRTDVTHNFQDGVETLIAFTDFGGNDRVDFWRLQQSGFFFHRTLMREEGDARQKSLAPYLDLAETAVHAAEAIFCLGRLYDGLLDELDEVAVTFRVLGAEGRLLTSRDIWRLALAKPAARIPEVTVTSIKRLGEWRASAADLAAEMTREVLLRFNFEIALSDLRQITERILRREI